MKNVLTSFSLSVCALIMATQAQAAPPAPTSSPYFNASPASVPWTYQPRYSQLELYWASVSSATEYEVYINGELETKRAATTAHLPFLEQGYNHLKYRACDSTGCSSFGPEQRIYVYGPPIAPPNLSLSQANASLYQSVTLSWTWAGGIINNGAHYQVKEISSAGTTILPNVPQNPGQANTSTSVSASLYGTTTYEVTACNPNNVCGSPSTVSLNVAPPLPPTPNAYPQMYSQPSSLAWEYQTASEDHYMFWAPISNASSYNVAVDNANIKNVSGTGGYFNFSAGYHYLKYQACNSTGCSDWGPEHRIYAYGQPAEPANLSATTHNAQVGQTITLSWDNAAGIIDVGSHYQVTQSDKYGSGPLITVNKIAGVGSYSIPITLSTTGWTSFEVSACNPNAKCGLAKKISVYVLESTANLHRGVYLGMYNGNGFNNGGPCIVGYPCDEVHKTMTIDSNINELSCTVEENRKGLDLDCLITEIINSHANIYYYTFSGTSTSHRALFPDFLDKLAIHAPNVRVYANMTSVDGETPSARATYLAGIQGEHTNLAGLSIDDFDLHLGQFSPLEMRTAKTTLNNANMELLVTAYYRNLLLLNKKNMGDYDGTFDIINFPVLIHGDNVFDLQDPTIALYADEINNIRRIMSDCDCNKVPIHTMLYATTYDGKPELTTSNYYIEQMTKEAAKWTEGVTMYRLPTGYMEFTNGLHEAEDLSLKRDTIRSAFCELDGNVCQ